MSKREPSLRSINQTKEPMNEQQKIAKLKEHLLTLRNWFMECDSLSDDEVKYQTTCIDELLDEIGEGV